MYPEKAHIQGKESIQLTHSRIQRRRLRVASGATAPGPTLEGAPHFRHL